MLLALSVGQNASSPALNLSGDEYRAISSATDAVKSAVHRYVVCGFSNSAVVEVPKERIKTEQYGKLWAALSGMSKLDICSADYIDDAARFDASNFLAILMSYEVSVPKIFAHGGDAVTFTWDVSGRRRRYVTPIEGEAELHEAGGDKPDHSASYELNDAASLNELMRTLGGRV